jgi:hypothetical protein
MIEDEPQYVQAKRALDRIEIALAALRHRIEPINQELFRAMAQSYLSNIENIRSEIDQYIGVISAEEARAPLWMTLEGERLSVSEISSHLLSDWLYKFRRALQHVAEYVDTGRQLTGRPSAMLTELTDFKIVALRPGSIRIGIRLPQGSQVELFPQEEEIFSSITYKALERLIDLIQWVESGEETLPADRFPDTEEAMMLINQVTTLVPPRRGSVRAIRFSGAYVSSIAGVRVATDALPRLRRLADALTHVYEDSVEGVIREIDLDARRIILRERGPDLSDIKCHLPEGLIAVAEGYLNGHVRVRGRFSSDAPDSVEVISIEVIGQVG